MLLNDLVERHLGAKGNYVVKRLDELLDFRVFQSSRTVDGGNVGVYAPYQMQQHRRILAAREGDVHLAVVVLPPLPNAIQGHTDLGPQVKRLLLPEV